MMATVPYFDFLFLKMTAPNLDVKRAVCPNNLLFSDFKRGETKATTKATTTTVGVYSFTTIYGKAWTALFRPRSSLLDSILSEFFSLSIAIDERFSTLQHYIKNETNTISMLVVLVSWSSWPIILINLFRRLWAVYN